MILNECDDDNIQSLFLRTSHLYFKMILEQLVDTGIHPGQLPMIIALGESDGMSQKEISKRLNTKPPTVAVSIKRLEKMGVVERIADSKDQRVIRVYLSEKGKVLFQKTKKLIEENEKAMFQGFTESEICLMKRFFQQIIKNIQNIPEEETYKLRMHHCSSHSIH